MRFPLIVALVALFLNALIDVYIYLDLISYCRRKFWPQVQKWSAIVLFVLLIAVIIMPKGKGDEVAFNIMLWTLYTYISIYVAKYMFVIFDALSRLPMLWRSERWKWMSWVGFGLALTAFFAMWWGALINRYQIQVNEVPVEVKGLPKAFDGFTIAQISDLHVGTFGSNDSFIEKLVDQINALHPDVVVFTGDIVNRNSEELDPFVKGLSRLRAKYGVYSILGNHDYGDYSWWPSDEAKAANLKHLKDMESQMGWCMLNNQTDWIKIGSDSLAMIGVENVGEPPFTTYGDLKKAYPNIGDANVKVLLSHNPTHWSREIADNLNSNIALTLSGHTHAMQIVIFGWSPSSWRYKLWGGKYTDGQGQTLYVNIGAGEVGFPARIGATPEISFFKLTSKN